MSFALWLQKMRKSGYLCDFAPSFPPFPPSIRQLHNFYTISFDSPCFSLFHNRDPYPGFSVRLGDR